MIKVAIITVANVIIFCGILFYAIGMWNKLHFAPVEPAPPSSASRDGKLEREAKEAAAKRVKMEAAAVSHEEDQGKELKRLNQYDHQIAEKLKEVEKKSTELDKRIASQELKADQFQCKTDPTVLKRLEEVEKWQKETDDAAASAIKKLKEMHKDLEQETKPKEDRGAKLDWIYDITRARQLASSTGRPIYLAFNQHPDLCKKCKRVSENCYSKARVCDELKTKFIPYWAPTGWSDLTVQYGVTGFPTVVIDYGGQRRETFAPSDDPDRLLQQLKEYEI